MLDRQLCSASLATGSRSFLGCFWGGLALALVLPLTSVSVGWAQAKPSPAKPSSQATPPAKSAPTTPAKPAREVAKETRPVSDSRAKNEIPPPVELRGNDLLTRDGVMLKATFYPGTKGKDTVPIVLLHSSKGDRKEYAALAPLLQQRGYAVLVPDLRSFGDSTQVVVGGQVREADNARLRPADYEAMVAHDMETIKGFLVRQNDEGQLNVNKLCVVGADMGASVALHWAKLDWSWPVLTGLKQGQDVKGLVLISPKWSFPGLPANAALDHPALRSQVSMLLVVGSGDQDSLSDARRMHRVIRRDESDLPPQKRTLFFFELDTKLQGAKLLGVGPLGIKGTKGKVTVEALIISFVEARLASQDYPWVQRGK